MGYVIARDSWGRGYATEALEAVTRIAGGIGVVRLQAHCHPDHAASCHVLEKCGFVREGVLPGHTLFPNLESDKPGDVACYARILG